MQGERWSFANASVIGTSHIKSGLPCQDFSLVKQVGADLLITAVCDGAGSACHSEIGSNRVANNFIDLAEAYFESGGKVQDLSRDIALDWLEQIRADLVQHAQQFERSPRDYSCTLLAAIIGADASAFFQIGDGAIVVSHGSGDGWSYVCWPQHGEYANSTNFVLAPNMPEVLWFEVANHRVNEVAVFSDGIENLVLHLATKTVHEPFFERMFKPLRSSTAAGLDCQLSDDLSKYLASPAICTKTDDDKTLVLATRCRL